MSLLNAGISILGALEYYETKNPSWALGAGVMAGIMSYTLMIVRPIFNKIL